MKEVSATEAARGFSALLDAVEHEGETFVVTRGGRGIARIEPAGGVSGTNLKALLRAHRPDRAWSAELRALRAAAQSKDREWPD